jgi:aerobic-type carbon monoxide dehydrogenase small subunit (CoxS/CutS family)
MSSISFTINGKAAKFEVEPKPLLLWVTREETDSVEFDA